MSFSSDSKNEMLQNKIENECCKKAFLAATIKTIGTISIRSRHKLTLKMVTENGFMARKVYTLFKEVFNFTPQIMVQQKQSLKKNNIYVLNLTGEQNIRSILSILGILDKNEDLFSMKSGINKNIIENDCCIKTYLMATFVSSGSVSNPNKAYHLEMVFSNEDYANDISDLLQHFDLNSKVIPRKNQFIVYLKEAENISDFLILSGAHSTLLDFENLRAFKDVRNNVQRLINCETANMNKTINASVKQVQDINLIKDTIGLDAIDPKLREIAELRLSYQEESLSELGELLDPAISRSGVNHRLRKIGLIAAKLRGETK